MSEAARLRLAELCSGWIEVDAKIDVTGLAADSREVRPGDLFAALSGSRTDGGRFVADAIAKGAVAVLAAPGAVSGELPVPLLTDADPRRRLSLLAARFFGAQPRTVVAVTGTNGKTSTVDFAAQLWNRIGHKAGSLGTLGVRSPGYTAPLAHTSPDPVTLHRHLAGLALAGVDHLAIEASSHGLDQRRLDGMRFAAAGFTNLTRDHLDYHRTVEDYIAAKRRLFDSLLEAGAGAVINMDDPVGFELADIAHARGLRLIRYGRAGVELKLLDVALAHGGLRVTAELFGRRREIGLQMIAEFQAMNALAAFGLVVASGADAGAAEVALPHLAGVPGRLQRAAKHPSGAPIYVDYAHTPDALAKALEAARPHATHQLVVVFGCGGDRDRGKRPQMGAIASAQADRIFVTDDNPRSEDPAAIRREILARCPGAQEVGDRAEAIRIAVAGLEAGDVLVIAGKGHEQGQIVGDRVLPFDDATVAQAAVEALAWRNSA
jgi:UDP-N-acetylmuramoyl-L-alanyl-D-glutamate--2,6-diaminopimelate ligase